MTHCYRYPAWQDRSVSVFRLDRERSVLSLGMQVSEEKRERKKVGGLRRGMKFVALAWVCLLAE